MQGPLNTEGDVGGEGECGHEVEVLLVTVLRSLDILSIRKFDAEIDSREMSEEQEGNGDEDRMKQFVNSLELSKN